MERLFFVKTFTVTFLLLAIYLGIFLVIDPFNIVHEISDDRYISTERRFAKKAIALSNQFDSFVVGTSMAAEFPLQDLNSELGAHFASLHMGGSMAYEQMSLLKVLPRSGYKTLILEIYFAAHDGVVGQTRHSSFPRILYDAWSINDVFVYLSDSDFVTQELRRGFAYNFNGEDRHPLNARLRTDGMSVVGRGAWNRLAAVEACKSVDTVYVDGAVEGFSSAYAEEMVEIASQKFEFVYCFFNPVSVISLRQRLIDGDRDNLTNYLVWKEEILNICTKHDNVALVDYQNVNKVTTDVTNYWDYNHYREQVFDLIARDVVSVRSRRELESDDFGELLVVKGQALASVQLDGLAGFDEANFYDVESNLKKTKVVSPHLR